MRDIATYDAYGERTQSTGSTENSYRFAGEQFDSNVGQYYLRARYYDAGVGRFGGRDPFEGEMTLPLSLAKYPYVHGNPVNAIDPSGLYTQAEVSVSELIGQTLAAVYYLSTRQTPPSLGEGIVPDYLVGQGSEAVDRLADKRLGIATASALQVVKQKIKECNKLRGSDEVCDFGSFPVIVWGSNLPEITSHTYEALSELKPSFLLRIQPPWTRDLSPEEEDKFALDAFAPLNWYHALKESPCYWNSKDLIKNARLRDKDCDEYPYASTLQGGRANYEKGMVSLKVLSRTQNRNQGRWLEGFYTDAGIIPNDTISGWFGVEAKTNDLSHWYRIEQGFIHKKYFY